MLWMTRTNNTSVIFFFLALTPSDLFKQTTPQQSWPINHLNGLKTYLMSLTNHFMKCHCSSWQDFLLHTSSLFCFTLSAPWLPCACAPSICIELQNFSVEQYSGDHLAPKSFYWWLKWDSHRKEPCLQAISCKWQASTFHSCKSWDWCSYSHADLDLRLKHATVHTAWSRS